VQVLARRVERTGSQTSEKQAAIVGIRSQKLQELVKKIVIEGTLAMPGAVRCVLQESIKLQWEALRVAFAAQATRFRPSGLLL
jgi:hypothetical protein